MLETKIIVYDVCDSERLIFHYNFLIDNEIEKIKVANYLSQLIKYQLNIPYELNHIDNQYDFIEDLDDLRDIIHEKCIEFITTYGGALEKELKIELKNLKNDLDNDWKYIKVNQIDLLKKYLSRISEIKSKFNLFKTIEPIPPNLNR